MLAGLGESNVDFKITLVIAEKTPAIMPAVNSRGAKSNSGKQMAKIPQPFPKNVSHAQIVSGTYCVNVLMNKNVAV